jgi:hypothetical protein
MSIYDKIEKCFEIMEIPFIIPSEIKDILTIKDVPLIFEHLTDRLIRRNK